MLRQTLQRFGFSGNDVNERHYKDHRARPLHLAARAYDERAVALLLAAGAEVDGLNEVGMSPLQWACAGSRLSRNYNLGVSRLLIAANADVNHRDTKFGNTVLHWAMVRGHEARDPVDTVTMLLEAGADATLPNDRGWAPLHIAAHHGDAAAAKALIAAGADPNAAVTMEMALYEGGAHPGPPYALALNGSHHGHRCTLRVLLQHGASPDVHAADLDRPAPIDLAQGRVSPAWDYHEKVKAAGGYDALVKQHRRILASVVDKVVEAKFGRRAPQEVCAHAALFIAPPGGS
jgi:hypothetical protein